MAAEAIPSIDLVVVLFRGVVLVIGALGACLSIFLGWKLYRDGMLSDVSGEATTTAGWSLKLTSAGPGVFFAFFGMWLLVHLADRTADVQTATPIAKTAQSSQQAPRSQLSPIGPVPVAQAGGLLPQYLYKIDTKATGPATCVVPLATNSIRFFNGQTYSLGQVHAGLVDATAFLSKLDTANLTDAQVTSLTNSLTIVKYLSYNTEDANSRQ